MVQCAVATCKNDSSSTKEENMFFHTFPTDRVLIKEWLVKCRRADYVDLKHACVCSEHFNESDYLSNFNTNLALSRKLRQNAVPSLKLPGKNAPWKIQEKSHPNNTSATPPLVVTLTSSSAATRPIIVDLKLYEKHNKKTSPNISFSEESSDVTDNNCPILLNNKIISSLKAVKRKSWSQKRKFHTSDVSNTEKSSTSNIRCTVETMTDIGGMEFQKISELENEIKWLWHRNQVLVNEVSALKARNIELIQKSYTAQKRLKQVTLRLDEELERYSEIENMM